MKKYSVQIKETYSFTFESESTSRKELEIEAEDYWNALKSSGLESGKYEETEVKVALKN